MAKYQQYAEYKDSGVEWLDVIPNHWNTVSLKMLIDVRDGTHETPSYVEKTDNSYPLVTSKDVTSGQIDLTDCKHISQQDYESIIKRSAVSEGDILMPMIGTVGSPVLVEECLEIAIKNLALFRTSKYNDKITAKFLHYFLNSKECSMQFSLEGKGGVQNFVSLGTLRSLGLPLISLEDQVRITDFLDYETAQINTLIEKQQTLIQLLKEKRQAVISHAVTKGLNLDAPMKDSGVEWLGEVPEHWEVGRLKNVLRIRNGRDYKEVEVESGGYPVYGSGGIFKRSSDYLFDGESVLFGRKGTVDKPLLVSGRFWTVDTMFYSEVFSNAKPNYIYYQALLFPFDQLSTNTALPSMTQENLLELGFVIPPFDEQEEICQYLSNKLKVFSNLVSKAEQAIQLMQERRTALISAAVTGKIDVRGWVAPESNN